MSDRIVLKCKCGLPWAYLQNGQLVVESKHYGETHLNQISLRKLIEVLRQGGEFEQIALPLPEKVLEQITA
jgi:hypothetical protein